MQNIKQLQREMNRLKEAMENPCAKEEVGQCGRINEMRRSIFQIRKEMEEAGNLQPFCEIEKRNRAFEKKIPLIESMTLSTMGFFSGIDEWKVKVSDNDVVVKVNRMFPGEGKPQEEEFSMDKEKFFEKIKKLYLGEWRSEYSPIRYGIVICDGMQWKMKICFRTEHAPCRYSGDNMFPWNFDNLMRILEKKE